jgi:hypothetical protein
MMIIIFASLENPVKMLSQLSGLYEGTYLKYLKYIFDKMNNLLEKVRFSM